MSDMAGPRHEVDAEGDEQGLVTLGRITGAHGIKGWVKVHSDTSPRENIVGYSPWLLDLGNGREAWEVRTGRLQGKALVAKLVGCDDRDRAESLTGAEIRIPRAQLPATTQPGEYYWADLIGLEVRTVDGVGLGRIVQMLETGANDVIVVEDGRERLIPYLWGQVVRGVDLPAGVMTVDWDPDF